MIKQLATLWSASSWRRFGQPLQLKRCQASALPRVICKRNLQLLVVLLSALALKQFYATAGVNQLRWILAPTAFLVGQLTGAKFEFESHAGYLFGDHTFVIAASCAGVNFLITAFLMLSLRKLWRNPESSWRSISASAGLAYLATLVTNTIRIAVAVQLHNAPLTVAGLNGNQLHRLEGILIYFGCLFLLFLLSERMSVNTEREAEARVQPGSLKQPGRLSRFGFPLLIYYATTLGLPLTNAAFHRGRATNDFCEHLGFVLLMPLLLLVPLLTWRLLKRQRTSLRSLYMMVVDSSAGVRAPRA